MKRHHDDTDGSAQATILTRLERHAIRRRGTPKAGFRYVDHRGRPVSAAERKRIAALKVPPAWRDVHISPSAAAKVQAMGRDRAGRWQYRYHAAQTARRERAKATRLVAFVRALPRMRKAVASDLRRTGLPRAKVLAVALRILSTCFLRPGSEEYANEHGSYGLATLRRRHVTVRGDLVTLDFAGKSGTQQLHELRDRAVARVVRELLRAPGHEVFKFQDDDGQWQDVKRRHVTEYVKEVMGASFSAKDFRTWAGTLICACALARVQADPDAAGSPRQQVATAVRETALALGNTPAVCRSSYIGPAVLAAFARGKVLAHHVASADELRAARVPVLQRIERALIALLERRARRRAA